jgi:glycerophosphoryl diester phosphodiesterase
MSRTLLLVVADLSRNADGRAAIRGHHERVQVNTPRVTIATGFPYLDAVLDPPGSVIAMAHRGGALHPDLPGAENTAHAFRHAVALGYRYLETDVHATSDGVLLAFHDEALDRVTDSVGLLGELTAEQVSLARIADLHAIPTMAELLEEFGDCRFNVDLKSDAAVTPLVELIDRAAAHDRVCVGSFSGRRIQAFRRATGGRVATAAAPGEVAALRFRLPALPRPGRRLRPAVLQVPWRHKRRRVTVTTPGFVRRAHDAGLHVHVWTGEESSQWVAIDDPESMETLLDMGVDGLITDRTDLLKEVLIRRGQWRNDQ